MATTIRSGPESSVKGTDQAAGQTADQGAGQTGPAHGLNMSRLRIA